MISVINFERNFNHLPCLDKYRRGGGVYCRQAKSHKEKAENKRKNTLYIKYYRRQSWYVYGDATCPPQNKTPKIRVRYTRNNARAVVGNIFFIDKTFIK